MTETCRNGRKIMKVNPPSEEDTSNLPCDIIENILSRLPVKSLVKFKSVSKPWYSIISDTKFARVHLHQSRNSDYKTIFVIYSRSKPQTFHLLKLTNQSFEIEGLEFPLKKYRQAAVLCSCDGLVLMKNSGLRDKMCVLWNPSTRRYTKFKCPYLISPCFSTLGLCYDAFNDDYKFVLILANNRYVVFSYKNKTWVEKEDPSLLRIRLGPGLFVNGALHWVAYESRKDFDSNAKEGMRLQQLHNRHYVHYVNFPVYKCDYTSTHEICYFDPRDDTFKMFSKPACFDTSSVFHLIDLRGQLCVYRNTYDSKMVDIWMMNEYGDCNSWTKLLTIENVPVLHKCYTVKPLCLTNEGNILLFINGSGIVLYSPKKEKFGEIHISYEENLNCLGNMIVTPLLCSDDSLVLPSRKNKTKS